eukprot:gene11593-12096_t
MTEAAQRWHPPQPAPIRSRALGWTARDLVGAWVCPMLDTAYDIVAEEGE